MKTVAAVLCLAACAWAGEVRAGYAKIDVTPREPVQLGGYDLRGAPSNGVHGSDRLFVRSLIFDDGTAKLAFVEADVIGIHDHDEFRKRISARTGIPVSNILLGDAHNHAAPAPGPKGGTAWEKLFGDALVSVVEKAVSSLQPVRLGAGDGHSRIAMNRRQVQPGDRDSFLTFDENNVSQSFGKAKTEHPVKVHEFGGVMRLGANPGGSIDDAVQVVRIDTAAGKPLAVMVHYACHGTSLGGRNGRISGEWMGHMQDYIERQIPGVGAIYIQGAAGDINPRVVGGLDGYEDNEEVTQQLGYEIAREVVRVHSSVRTGPVTSAIELRTKDILLPRTYRELFEDFRNTAIPTPTTAVRMGDLMWVTFPGEMFHAIGQKVKAACPSSHAHLAGYVNGYIGYFPEQKAFAEGGYEPATSHLDPTAENVYLREIADLLKQFR